MAANSYRPEFNPHQLRFARERRGLTKEAFAKLCGVTRRAVTDWESGNVVTPPIDRISHVLGFPSEFFVGDDIEEIASESVSFRALSSMTPRQVHQVLAHASLIRRFAVWVDARYSTPRADVPSIEELTASEKEAEPSAVEGANALRTLWGLGARPIKDMLVLLESHGVRVFGLPPNDREIDAFSFWYGDQPLIFLNTTKSSERMRFDLAHELGHLCLHREVCTNRNRRYELDANSFASAFLMPRTGLLPQIVGHLTLPDIMRLKAFWRVSAMAMVRRLHQLGRVSDWQYRTWMIDLTKQGFRSSEPGGMPNEQSELLGQVMTLARQDGLGLEKVARECGIPTPDLVAALMGLTVIPLTRPVNDPPDPTPPQGDRSSLRLVR